MTVGVICYPLQQEACLFYPWWIRRRNCRDKECKNKCLFLSAPKNHNLSMSQKSVQVNNSEVIQTCCCKFLQSYYLNGILRTAEPILRGFSHAHRVYTKRKYASFIPWKQTIPAIFENKDKKCRPSFSSNFLNIEKHWK